MSRTVPPKCSSAAPSATAAPGAAARELPESVIDCRPLRALRYLRQVWSRRELILFLGRRDVKVRYRDTVLGLAWAILQPAMMTVIFSIFVAPFAGGGTDEVPYPVHVYLGFLAWQFFASSLVGAGNSVVSSQALLSKVYFPRIILPLASVGANLLDLAVAGVGLIVLLACYGIRPAWTVLLLPAWVMLMTLAALGAGTLAAALNVRFRDFRYLIPFIVQAWMFATPNIFLQTGSSPGRVTLGSPAALLLQLNPLAGLIGFFRAAVLGTPLPWTQVGVSALLVLAFLTAAFFYFRRVEDRFADLL